MKKLSKQKGFTLIELLISVGVASVLAISGLYFYKKQMDMVQSRNQATTLKLLNQSVQSYSQVLEDNVNLNTISNANLLNSNLASTFNVSEGKLVNNYGGEMNVEGLMFASEPSYKLTLKNLPTNACNYVSTSFSTYAVDIKVNGINVKNLTTELDPAILAAACTQQDNNIEFVTPLLKKTVTTLAPVSGNNGNPDNLLVADLHKTAIGATCPANSISNGFGCGCPEGDLWDGVKCSPISSANRLNGITLGTSKPVVSASLTDLKNNITTGDPAIYNNELNKYIPDYMTIPAASVPGKEGFIIADKSPDSIANSSFCTNGLVLKETVSGSTVTRSCVEPTFTYSSGGVDQTVTVSSVNDTNKYKHCLLGTIDDIRCKMPEDTKTNTAPTTWQSTVNMPSSNTGGRCTNGQIWDVTTKSCSCSANTVLNSNGYCGCQSGQKFNKDSQTCEAI